MEIREALSYWNCKNDLKVMQIPFGCEETASPDLNHATII
jgi:hypothetical protein